MQSFVEFEQGKIYFQEEGNGHAVILLHGFLENMNMWAELRSKLSSKGYRAISIDLPGHGRSSVWEMPVTMDFMARAVKSVVDALSIHNLVIIGHSMGGYVAQTFAEKYSSQIVGFGYFHSHASADTPEAKINRGRAIKVVEENHKSYISNFIPDLFTSENQIVQKERIKEMMEEAAQMNKMGIVGALNAMRERKDGLRLLKSTKVPVMFIIGRQDIRAPHSDLLQQIQLPEKCHILMLEKVAHMGFIEDFQSTSNFILGFINSCYAV